jgi:hypothetical protein
MVPAVTALVVVCAFVAVSGWNRSSEPLQIITLTERELTLPHTKPADDDPGVQLRINYSGRSEAIESRNWLTDDRLRALGFAMQIPVGAPEAKAHYRRAMRRVGWVVLEYDGSVWQEMERRRALLPEYKQIEFVSRLVAIDSGPEFEPLLARYPTGHMILRAIFGLSYHEQTGPVIHGYIQQLVPNSITVPMRLRNQVEDLTRQNVVDSPRYEVDVALGRLGIPYVRDIRRLR